MADDTTPISYLVPSLEEIHHIIRSPDPVQRNLRITQTYHELKLALARRFGPRNVSWCAYATWASKTAGRFIRGELVPSLLTSYVTEARPMLEQAIARAAA